MTDSFPALLVSRRPRQAGLDWSGASSWLGGAPRLGSAPWPRDTQGEPLHFAAQISLGDVAAATGGTPLPSDGALAFFIGGKGAVIHVPDGSGAAPAQPPSDTPDLAKSGGARDWPHDLEGLPLFPYWPIGFSRLDLGPPPDDPDADDYDDQVEAYRAAQRSAVRRRLPQRDYNLSPTLAFAGPPVPDWWQTAFHYAAYLDHALAGVPKLLANAQISLDHAVTRAEQAQSGSATDLKTAQDYVRLCRDKIATIQALTPVLRDFAAEIWAFCHGRDRWAVMTIDEQAQLSSLWARNPEFAAIHFNQGRFALDYLKDEMFKALPVAGTAEFASLPGFVRELIDLKRAPRPVWWHSALTFVARLRDANRRGVPQATKPARDQLDADRRQLASLQPSGPFAFLRRVDDSRANEIAEVEARIAATEARLAERQPAEAAFVAFTDDMAAWVAGRDPWQRMATDDIVHLTAALERTGGEFREFTRFIVPARIEDLESSTLRAMIAGPDRAYDALPEAVRDLVNRDYLLPPGYWHQMFGWGEEIQGDSCAMREEGNIMLLQLTHDDMMAWSFGDNGIYQFWIDPEDLRRRDWSRVRMTCESH